MAPIPLKKFRESLHLPGNEQLLAQYQQKQREYSKKYVQKQFENPDLAAKFRKRRAEIMQANRGKKSRLELDDDDNGFNSPSALGKAVRRIENGLPLSNTKAQGIVKVIGRKLDLNISNAAPPSKRIKKSFIGVEDLVEEFYEKETTSRSMPGKADYVNIKNASGETEKVQKRLLLMTVSDAHQKFCSLHPQVSISSSKFHKLRPEHIVIMAKAPHNMCLCQYCENIKFVFESFAPFTTTAIETLNDLMIKLVCCRDNFECMSGSCEECELTNEKILAFISPQCNDQPIRLQRWEKVENFMRKVFMRGKKLKDALKMFMELLPFFKMHSYLICSQYEFLEHQKYHQTEHEALLIVDYSQNYSATSQDEIQSAYFAQRQIAVFTAYTYVGKNEPIPYLIVSDDINHSKEQVWCFLELMIKDLLKRHQKLEKIRMMSDGCAQQFKNKFTLTNLLHAKDDFGVKMEWHFFPTSHGKSAADGLGGTFKRNVFARVLTGELEVGNAKEFYECAKSFAGKTTIFLSLNNAVQDVKGKLNERWKSVKTIAGTRNFHFFSPSDEAGKIQAAVSSRLDGMKTLKV